MEIYAKIPTWALAYIINDDESGLTDEEVLEVDEYTGNMAYLVCAPEENEDSESEPYFDAFPAFGLPGEVVDCHLFFENINN